MGQFTSIAGVIYASVYKHSLNFLMIILDTGDKKMNKGSPFPWVINLIMEMQTASDNYMCQLVLKVTLMDV